MKKPEPITAEGYCRGGVIEWRVAWKFIKAAASRWPDGPVIFTLAPKDETRRGRANRWLWGVCYKLILLEMNGRVTKATQLELHEAMTYRHNPVVVVDPISRDERRTGGPTSTMSVERFGQFIEDVMLDGSTHFGIIWPEPRSSEEWRDGKAA